VATSGKLVEATGARPRLDLVTVSDDRDDRLRCFGLDEQFDCPRIFYFSTLDAGLPAL
jgi:hypothetical protein